MTTNLPADPRIPVTVLTGFLGAGKTTLLNQLLRAPAGRRIAVIENELGEQSIDGALLINTADEIVTLNNGCLCCTIRQDLVTALGELAERRFRGELQFDTVVIETTGVAEPAPVIQTLLAEPAMVGRYRLDAVVTLVDAIHGLGQLLGHKEAQAQIASADLLLVSKGDHPQAQPLSALEPALRRLNPLAPISAIEHGQLAADALFERNAYDQQRPQRFFASFGQQPPSAHQLAISAVMIEERRPFDLRRFEIVLAALTQTLGEQLLRYKGVVAEAGNPNKVVFQGVQMIYGGDEIGPWGDEEPISRMVFIGRELPETTIRGLIDTAIADADQSDAA